MRRLQQAWPEKRRLAGGHDGPKARHLHRVERMYVVHPDDLPRISTVVEEALRKKTDFTVDCRILLDGGALKHVQIIGHPACARNGDPVEYVGTVVDVTERKKVEEERERLRQVQAHLAYVNRITTMGELTASLAHEIKQPIAAALLDANVCLRALADNRLDVATACNAASRIVKDVAWADEVINRTSALFKKESTERERVNIDAVIREMAALLQQEASASSIAIRTQLAEDISDVMADRVQLQQVFMNLMLNAIDAMKGTGGELTITSQMREGSELLIDVSDTGVGLPADNPEQMFESFVTTKPHGTGMGLTITRSIVESHDGRMWVTRNSGPGATFHFTLPLRARAATPASADGAIS